MVFLSLREKGWFIDFGGQKPDNAGHYFCGSHHIKGALCWNCKKPLLLLLNININDSQFSFIEKKIPGLFLFFCWTCEAAQDFITYRILNEYSVEILFMKRGHVEKDFPYRNYPEFFPSAGVDFIEITDEEQQIIKKINANECSEMDIDVFKKNICDVPRHQLCGEPYLVQSLHKDIECFQCGKKMLFLASIADNCVDPRGFTGNPYVQVLFFCCLDCSVITGFQQCD